ncbi:MAG: flagellar assembly protein FliH [Planctomycetaceae bacterium]|nr:flagellar assembly protein FliH [Planctomycetaceae bacterium]
MLVSESARLLKAGTALPRSQSVSFQFADFERECESRVRMAREQAEELIHAAQAEAERVLLQARQEGYAAGLTEGRLEIEREFEPRIAEEVQRRLQSRLTCVVSALHEATSRLVQDREQIVLQWEKSAIGLSVAIARRIVRRELRFSPEPPRALIAEALELASGATSIVLRLNPEDVAELELSAAEWQQLIQSHRQLTVIADSSLSRGGCLVETPEGEIDGRMETQFSRIVTELWGEES